MSVIGAVLFFAAAATSVAQTLVPEAGVELTGHFVRSGEYPSTVWLDGPGASKITFGSYDGGGANTGTFTTAAFRAPEKLEFYVSGFPRQPDLRMYLRAENLPLGTIDLRVEIEPGNTWRLRTWQLPPEWMGRQVRLVVEDRATGPFGWIGVTLPEAGGNRYASSLMRAAWRGAALLGGALLLVVPGIAIALALNRRLLLPAHQLLVLILIATGLLGYTCFWIYLWNGSAGRIASICIRSGGLLGLGLLAIGKQRKLFWGMARELAYPCVAFGLTAVLYSSLGFLYLSDSNTGPELQNRFFDSPMPSDNSLPQLMAVKLYAGNPIRPTLSGEWQASDRPPLQAGLYLTAMPNWLGISEDLSYQLIAVALQTFWVLAVWVLLRSAGCGYGSIVPVLGLCIFSGFGFLHSAYVWPKLLAASFCIMGISFFLPFPKRGAGERWSGRDAVLAALCIALGLLAHTGCALTLIALPVLLAAPRKTVKVRHLVVAALCAMVLLVPWVLFQKLYDPPGDQLIKLNLTGNMNRNISLPKAFLRGYKYIGWEEFRTRKIQNLRLLFAAETARYPPKDFQRWVRLLVTENFFSFFQAIGLLNLGLILRFSPLWRKRKTTFAGIDRLAAMVGVSLVLWILVMYERASTTIHSGSLANVLLILVCFGLWVAAVFPRGIYLLLGVQAALLFPVFVFGKKVIDYLPGVILDVHADPGMLAVAACCAAGLCAVGYRAVRTDKTELVS